VATAEIFSVPRKRRATCNVQRRQRRPVLPHLLRPSTCHDMPTTRPLAPFSVATVYSGSGCFVLCQSVNGPGMPNEPTLCPVAVFSLRSHDTTARASKAAWAVDRLYNCTVYGAATATVRFRLRRRGFGCRHFRAYACVASKPPSGYDTMATPHAMSFTVHVFPSDCRIVLLIAVHGYLLWHIECNHPYLRAFSFVS
jgi:hypothetical protein